jgi:hypothetical protein
MTSCFTLCHVAGERTGAPSGGGPNKHNGAKQNTLIKTSSGYSQYHLQDLRNAVSDSIPIITACRVRTNIVKMPYEKAAVYISASR